MLMTYSFGHPCNLSLFHMLNSHTVNIFKLRCNGIENINLEAQFLFLCKMDYSPHPQWEVPTNHRTPLLADAYVFEVVLQRCNQLQECDEVCPV